MGIFRIEKKDFQQGIKAAMPVVMGFLPIGMAFGVLAAQAGLTVGEVFLMSLIVYAGSSQFIAVGLLLTGASPWTIIAATFLVNSRHILMSASLAPYLKGNTAGTLSILGFGVTDETYGVAIGAGESYLRSPSFLWGLNTTAHLTWVISTTVGSVAGGIMANPEALGLDFALPAMFIGLLVGQLKDGLSGLIAGLAALLAILFKIFIPGNWYIILAALITATIGVVIETWMQKY